MMTPPPGYIDEYRELRAEIRLLLDRRSKSVQFVLLLTTAAVALPRALGTPSVLLVAAVMVGFLWFDEIRRLRALYRVGAYLEVCVEPHVAGLKWETRGAQHPIQTNFVEKLIANGFYPASVLLLFGVAFHRLTWSVVWQLALLGAFVLLLVFLTLASYGASTKGRQREVNWWRSRPVTGA